MKSELLRQFRNLFQEKKVTLNKRLLTFLFFLLLSSFIWLLNTLDKDYITELNFPVNYENFPKHLVQTEDLPSSFTLRVEASGYLLLKHKIGKTIYPLTIDILEFLSESLLRDTIGFDIRTSSYREEIENQLHKQIKVIDIKPEILHFYFEKEITKEIPVKPVFQYRFGKQLIFKNDPDVSPSMVFVSGPKNILDTISFIPSVPKDLGIVNDNITTSISLLPIRNLTYSISKAKLSIEVEKYTESTFQIPIHIINIPDTVSLILNPEFVTLSYCTGLSSFKRINPAQFSLNVDFKEYVQNKTSKLTVLVKNAPEEVFNIRVNPRAVNYIIKNNIP